MSSNCDQIAVRAVPRDDWSQAIADFAAQCAENGIDLRKEVLSMGNGRNQEYAAEVLEQVQMPLCSSPGPAPSAVPGSPYPMEHQMGGAPRNPFIHWSPALGACPDTLPMWLCWVHYGLCSFNKFGEIGSSVQSSNLCVLPDPAWGMQIGPNAQPCSAFFPTQWVSEAMGRGIYRVLSDFSIRTIDTTMTPEEIRRDLSRLDFLILQLGTEDPFTTVLDFGEQHDTSRSELLPALGGYYLNYPFVPYVLNPSVFAWVLRGTAPGDPSGPTPDEYEFFCDFRSWWTPVCGNGAERPLNWRVDWRRFLNIRANR